jgi:hypothetical protein
VLQKREREQSASARDARRPRYRAPAMDLHVREMLEELAGRLHLHHGEGEERAQKLHGEVRQALDNDEQDNLADRFTEEAVEFETAHPDLANFLRRLADSLAAGGV